MNSLISRTAHIAGFSSLLCIAFICGCKEDPILEMDIAKNDYTVNWITKFGLVDQDHTWSVVNPISAEVNPSAYAPDATVYIYSANPTNGGKLIGMTSSCTTLSIDAMADCSRLFVQVLDSRGNCYENSYYPISDGRISITGKRSASRDASSVSLGATKSFPAGTLRGESREDYDPSNPYTLAEAKEKIDKTYLWKKSCQKNIINDYNFTYTIVFEDIYGNEIVAEPFQYYFKMPSGFTAYGGFTSEEISTIECGLTLDMNKRLIHAASHAVTYQSINGVETSHDKSVMIKDLAPLFGKGSYFEEQRSPSCLERWKDYFNPDVEFTISGPLTLDFMYGATQNKNMFGYYFWQDGDDPTEAIRYILIDNATPTNNISINTSTNYLSDGMQLAGIMVTGTPEESEDMLIGTSYKVPYFDAAGNPSYDFPDGTHVAFFLIVNGMTNQEAWLGNTNLSVQSHNYAVGRTFSGYKRESSDPDPTKGEIDAISFQYGSQFYLGFEDRGGDKDMNDVVFFVSGNAKPAEPYIKISTGDSDDVAKVDPKDPAPETPIVPGDADSWIIACEDLGSTDDYDFNDIVFSVSHVAGSSSAFITPLAAGGILEAQIYYNGSPINGSAENSEIHYLLTGQHYSYPCPMLNTSSDINIANANTVEISVPADFSMARDLPEFSVRIQGQESSYVITIPDKGSAPQIICLPGDWCWPTERTDITVAYPDFKNWSKDHTALGWLKNKIHSHTIRR